MRTYSEKKQIYYARTYRHLRIDKLEMALFLLLFVLPSVILILFFYDELAYLMVSIAAHAIQAAGGTVGEIVSDTFIPFLGPSYYLTLPTTLPSYDAILLNLAVALLLLWILSTGPQKGRPVIIYLSIILLIHMITCVFFLLGRDLFPYTLTDFSDLYVKQQIGIWITFLILIGLIMGILGRGAVIRRILTVVGLMAYSFLFGVARYVLFLWILDRFSVLYMPLMFFSLGPFFDFLYFVAIYAICTNGMIRLYEHKRKGDWLWA